MSALAAIGPRTRSDYFERYSRHGRPISGLTDINKDHIAAQEASAQLHERCNGLFRKYGNKCGIGQSEAMVVQLYGWPVLNRLKAHA